MTDAGRWRLATWVVGGIMAAGICWSVLAIPLQMTDSLVPILQAQSTPSVIEAFTSTLWNEGYLRPMRIGQIQVLYELAGGRHYFLVYKAFHILLILATFAAFILALRVHTSADFLNAVFALTVLTGLHTFLGTVWEAYPINHFLEIGMLCLVTFLLAQSRGGWLVDVAACLVFVVASLTLESGLLVAVVVFAGRLVGMRGVSRWGLAAIALLVLGYLYLRFGATTVGLPGLSERASGFGTTRLEPSELMRRFGERPYVFYAYNVLSSFLSVLVSEPRGGVWAIPLQLDDEGLLPGTVINVVTSVLTTVLIGWFAVTRRSEWRHLRFGYADQIVLVTLAVLLANAAISYGYTKDEIMSPAGMFYALAAFVGARETIRWAAGPGRGIAPRAVLGLLLLVVACGWTFRSVGVHYHMRRMAFEVRNEWVGVNEWLAGQQALPTAPVGQQLVEHLREDALGRPVLNPFFLPHWAERWFQ